MWFSRKLWINLWFKANEHSLSPSCRWKWGHGKNCGRKCSGKVTSSFLTSVLLRLLYLLPQYDHTTESSDIYYLWFKTRKLWSPPPPPPPLGREKVLFDFISAGPRNPLRPETRLSLRACMLRWTSRPRPEEHLKLSPHSAFWTIPSIIVALSHVIVSLGSFFFF